MEFKFDPLIDEVSRKMQDECKGQMPAGEVVTTPSSCVFPRNFTNYAQRIRDLEVREDDVWLISFPKCGSTWAQEMVWLLKNNIDFERAKKEYLHMRFIFLEYKALCAEGNEEPDTISNLENKKSPRFIKTHLPLELLPKQIWTKRPKIIYISRNPNDVAISYFHHFRLWNNYTGTQDLFLQAFVEDKVVFSPFWKHVLSYWKIRHESHVIFISFEDMKEDLASIMRQVGEFLNVSYTPEQESALLHHLSFASMRDNKAVNFEDDLRQLQPQIRGSFIREGEVGTWKKVLSPEFTRIFEQWTEKHLRETDYPQKLVEKVKI